MITSDFTLGIRVIDAYEQVDGCMVSQRHRLVHIEIQPLDLSSPDGSLAMAQRLSQTLKRVFEGMPTPCEVSISGQGVPR